MIGTQSELDSLVVFASFIASIVLVPILANNLAYVPRLSSLPTAIALFVFVFVFFDEGLILGGVAELISALMWTAIFIWRGKLRR